MKAVFLTAPGRFEMRDCAVPEPGRGEVLVRMQASTICTSDVQDIQSPPPEIALPMILGHEASGTVAGVGAGVTQFCEGDRVTAHPVHHCGKCPTCLRGLEHLCEQMTHFGLNLPGTFAEYFVVRADRARRLPNHVDFPLGALSEPVAVCMEAVQRANFSMGGNLLILGDGPFGLMMGRIAAKESNRRVAVAGCHRFRLGFSGRAEGLLLPESETRRDFLMNHETQGWDAVILAVASQEAFDLALSVLRPRGRLVVFAPLFGRPTVDLQTVLMKELEICGACNDEVLFDAAVDALSDPDLALHEIITTEFPFEDFGAALDEAASHPERCLKVALRNPSCP